MESTTSNISRTVMRRVHIMHTVRPFLSGTVLASVLFLGAVWGIGREVWVAHVIENMPSTANVLAVMQFFVSAFLNTQFIVQVLAIVAGAALVWAARDIARSLSPNHSFA